MSDLRTRLDAALDGYRIDHQIGEGGMAVVFLAHDLKHSRRVALKVMKPEVGASLGTERFLREIKIAAQLSHPHILPLYDSGEVDGLYYLVMPFVEGESLRDRLERDGTLPLPEAVRLTSEIAEALGCAHDQGLIHRDVKPENVLFHSGHAAVTDFGIARGMTQDEETRLTGTGVAVGTVAYMSPEQAVGEAELDARTDVYALGCVLYEMLEGTPPFAGGSAQAVLTRKVMGEVPEFSATSSVPDTVTAVVRHALTPSPEERFATPIAFARALETAITTEAIEAAAVRKARMRRRRASILGAGLAGVVAAGWWLATLAAAPSFTRIALLPLANETGDSSQAFFIDGMHDALIAEMGRAGIEVIGRRSVLRYRDDDETPVRDIARELNVDAVIEGFAFRQGDSVGVRISLVDGATEASLWSASYGATARNVIGLYRQVTAAIAEAIGFRLSTEAAQRLASAPQVDPEAYEAYLNGMYHWYRLTPQDLVQAERYFTLALEIDPDYALAHQGISFVWGARQQMGLASPDEAGPKAGSAAQRALLLDSTLAEVHLSMANQLTGTEWDWQGADVAFRRALELNPSYAEARAFYSHLLVFLGRLDEASEQADLAVAADPLNSLISALSCVALSFVGRFEDAAELCDAALEADPTHPVALSGRGNVLRSSGRIEEYLQHEIASARMRQDEEYAETLEAGYRKNGIEGAFAGAAELMVARSEFGFVSPTWIADAFEDAGNDERALDWLERGEEMRDPGMPYRVTATRSPALWDHPRFQAIRRRMGLSE
ncbi:MAG: protein kinase [Gemmatimonadetes bacterium]|nr:protein kinase [Gemmatimonadota bacterium]